MPVEDSTIFVSWWKVLVYEHQEDFSNVLVHCLVEGRVEPRDMSASCFASRGLAGIGLILQVVFVPTLV